MVSDSHRDDDPDGFDDDELDDEDLDALLRIARRQLMEAVSEYDPDAPDSPGPLLSIDPYEISGDVLPEDEEEEILTYEAEFGLDRLKDKVAIVTGAGRGIGRAEALFFASEGANVVINDIDLDCAEQVLEDMYQFATYDNQGALVTDHDVATWSGAEQLIKDTIERFGRLDILVNNAGIVRDAMSFSMTEEDWDEVIRVHLKGHFCTSHFAGAYWRERAKAGEEVSGRIINTTSESGLYGLAGQINYATAKAGIAAMTIVLARELAKYGVTVNAIAPRARTRMTEAVLGGLEPKPGEFDEWDPANIAPIVAWLATDEASHITGQVFVVFGRKVHLMRGWDLHSTFEIPEETPDPILHRIDQDSRLIVNQLIHFGDALFATRDPGLPPVGFGS